MATYRAFELNDVGRVCGRIDLVCEDDEDAKAQARHLAINRDIELWQADRRIAFLTRHEQRNKAILEAETRN
jgi:hypothetical protein